MDNYYIGLDLGSDSVGWAATDENYNLLKLNRKSAFGARIFSAANGCVERRSFRSSRRRMARRKYRIHLLNELLCEEISKTDDTFFLRLSNSMYKLEDKKHLGKSLLFKSIDEEKQFNKLYPTIWHLRQKLIYNDEIAFSNIKNVYFALHHIIKYRGNFISENDISSKGFNYERLNDLNNVLKSSLENEDDEPIFDGDIIYGTSENWSKIESILSNKELNAKNKQKQLKESFNYKNKNDLIDLFVIIVTGGKKKINDIEICFNDSFDDKEDEIQASLGEQYDVVLIAKEMFDYIYVKKLMGEHKYLSDSMVDLYDKHARDLKLLKSLIKKLDLKLQLTDKKSNYYAIFKKNKIDEDNKKQQNNEEDKNSNKNKKGLNNYPSYVGHNSCETKCNIEDFNDTIKKLIIDNKQALEEIDLDTTKYILEQVENKTFLKTIASYTTSAIPHQLHENELKVILKNAKSRYPTIFANDLNEKIIKLFLFRVPYYYGPLNSESPYSNLEKKDKYAKVYPWNVNEIIDDNKTRQKFMAKLTNKCQYLEECNVLPKSSLLYEEYMILDRLNTMIVNGERLNHELKDKLYKEIISKKKTTLANIQKLLSEVYNFNENEVIISGVNLDVAFEAVTHYTLSKEFDLPKDYKMLEELINYSTIFADDKKELERFIRSNYSFLSDAQIKCIKSLGTKKWASFSRELLDGITVADELGEVNTIIGFMRNQSKNFQEVLNGYGFNKVIDIKNREFRGDKTKAKIIKEKLDAVPAIFRRTINQTLLILDDIVSVAKKEPSKIFVEVTREDLKNKDKIESKKRRKELEEFLKSIKNDEEYYYKQAHELLEELNDERISDLRLKGKHLYLYFKQLGLDLYSGEKINIEDVLNSDKYDIDHIVPQKLIKDDSLDNMVLVNREANQKIKKDTYPLPLSIRNEKTKSIWKYLVEKKAITQKKYDNLVRDTEITDSELSQFINRQINNINASNKIVKDIINIKYPNTDVIFSKAQYPSFIRKEYKIVKVRELNDAHHAVDAYLNIVSGNILYTTFSNMSMIMVRKKINDISQDDNKEKTDNMESVIKYNFKKNNLLDRVKKTCFRKDALITYKCDFVNSGFYDMTIYKAENNLIPIHTKKDNPMNDVTKYGGYSSAKSSKLALIEYTKGKKVVRKINAVKPIYEKMYSNDEDKFLKIIANDDKAQNIKLLRYIPINQKIIYDGGYYLLLNNNEKCNKLKLIYQNYIDNDLLYYFTKAKKLIDIEDNEAHPEQLEQKIITSRNGKPFVISKEKNLEIMKALYNNAFNKVYDSSRTILDLRNDVILDIFESQTLSKQLEIILDSMIFMSRNYNSSELYNTKKYKCFEKLIKTSTNLVSKNISNNKIYLIHDSPSGLYSYKEKI